MTTLAASDDIAVLADLVGDIQTFADHHWGARPLLRRADVAPVLTVDDIESLLLTGARTPTYRLVRNGERIAPEHASRPVRIAGQLIADVADVERIAAGLGDGATLVAQGLERTSLRIARLCRSLERATSHPVQANAYLTPAGAVGLSSHHDDHDVIVVQQSGDKTWTIEGLGEITLTPGDVLYLPAGTAHSAAAQQRASLHLTIGLLTRNWSALVRAALDELDDLRAPLPLGYANDDGLAARVAEVMRDVAKRLADVDASAVAAREVERALARRRPLLDGHVGDVLSVDEIGLDSVVTRRADQRATLRDDGERVAVVMRDREIDFPSIGAAALRRLLEETPVRVGDLPGIDDDSKVVVVRRLVRAGLVRIEESRRLP